MKPTLVSIIIPVHNAQEHLENCLNSVIAQSYKNIEIICIDNNSTDKSLDILYNYQQKDSRIVILTCDIKGPSDTRNIGLDYACGKYITFLDSDDSMHIDFVGIMFHKIQDNKLDMLSCGIAVYDYKSKHQLQKNTGYYNNSFFVKNNNLEIVDLDNVLQHFHEVPMFCFGKMFNNAVIKNNHIRFLQNIFYNEDIAFNYAYAIHGNKFGFINDLLINHNINMKSSIMTNLVPHVNDMFITFDFIEELLKKNNKFDLSHRGFYSVMLRNIAMLARKKHNTKLIFYKKSHLFLQKIPKDLLQLQKKSLQILFKNYILYYVKYKLLSNSIYFMKNILKISRK